MPTTRCGKVRRMLKNGQAEMPCLKRRRTPDTIRSQIKYLEQAMETHKKLEGGIQKLIERKKEELEETGKETGAGSYLYRVRHGIFGRTFIWCPSIFMGSFEKAYCT